MGPENCLPKPRIYRCTHLFQTADNWGIPHHQTAIHITICQLTTECSDVGMEQLLAQNRNAAKSGADAE